MELEPMSIAASRMSGSARGDRDCGSDEREKAGSAT
jgi:hypothetical protein